MCKQKAPTLMNDGQEFVRTLNLKNYETWLSMDAIQVKRR